VDKVLTTARVEISKPDGGMLSRQPQRRNVQGIISLIILDGTLVYPEASTLSTM